MQNRSLGCVYCVGMDGRPEDSVLKRLERLCCEAGLKEAVNEGELVAVKVHFGELGNTRMLRPQFLKVITRLIQERGAYPFLTDCNTLFYRHRYDAVVHLETARFNGFDHASMGVPVVIADGLKGLDYRAASFGPGFLEVKVGAAIYEADGLVTVTHFKGHDQTGFGGVIKNLGVGAIARCGKLILHSASPPSIQPCRCDGCAACVKVCPAGAVKGEAGAVYIDAEKCVLCGFCLAVCSRRAIDIAWDSQGEDFQKRVVESFAAVVSSRRKLVFYVSFLVDITPVCDCRSWSPIPLVGDIGILAGFDPVAIDQAGLDLVQEKIRALHKGAGLWDFTGVSGDFMLDYAEKLGLGTRNYRLLSV